MGLEDFVKTYYIDPIYNGAGYNIYNTITYAVIFILISVLVFKMIKKLNITLDKKFFLSITPFIILGGLLRALEDASAIKNPLFITPLIYVTIFFIALISLVVSKYIGKKNYYKIWASIGVVLLAYSLTFVKVTNDTGLVLILGITLAWIVAIFLFGKFISFNIPSNKIGVLNKRFIFVSWMKSKIKNVSLENETVLSAHMFDATTTFVSIQYFPYYEQHVLPGFLIGIFGPAIMFVLKLVVVSIVLYYIDKEQNNEQKLFIKMLILILGLGPGIRNFVRLIMGV